MEVKRRLPELLAERGKMREENLFAKVPQMKLGEVRRSGIALQQDAAPREGREWAEKEVSGSGVCSEAS